MRAVIQIIDRATLSCEGKTVSECQKGMCVFLGLKEGDTEAEALWILDKILKMRIFHDENGKLNLSPSAVGADILLVSNFTLYANCNSRRPDFLRAMKYEAAEKLYRFMLEKMQEMGDGLRRENERGIRVFPGVFGGDMKVELVNDGPITIILDTDEDR